MLKMSKLEEVSHEMLVFPAPTCLVSSLWFSCGVAVSMREAPTLHTLHFTLRTPHFTPHTPHSTLSTPHSTLHTLHSTHSTLYTPHAALHTPHCRLVTGEICTMYKTVQISYCRKVFCVIAYPCVLTSVPLTYV